MRNTIVFLTLLVFISCTKKLDPSSDRVLLELSKDPRASAIFSFMQLKSRASPLDAQGLNTIIALLDELNGEARKQLVEARKAQSRNQAESIVVLGDLQGQEHAYTNKLSFYKQEQQQAEADTADHQDNRSSKQSRREILSAFLNRQSVAHNKEIENIENNLKQIASGLDLFEQFQNDLNGITPNPTSTADIQMKLEKIAAVYLQIHSVKVVIPSNFAQLAADDHKLQNRILEWTVYLQGTLLSVQSEWRRIRDERVKLHENIVNEVNETVKELDNDLFELEKENISAGLKLKQAVDGIAQTTRLLDEVEKLLGAASNYYNQLLVDKAVSTSEEDVKIFQKLKDYFLENYGEIKDFINQLNQGSQAPGHN